jgi:hypothetical protein
MDIKRYSTFAVLFLCFVMAAPLSAAEESRGPWELLGRQEADFRKDHDRIDVGRHEGRFKQLQIRVDEAPVEIRNMVITFNDGKTFKPSLRHRFDERSKSHVIDLPGNRRVIKSIDFDYRSTNRREGKAIVAVYGR